MIGMLVFVGSCIVLAWLYGRRRRPPRGPGTRRDDGADDDDTLYIVDKLDDP